MEDFGRRSRLQDYYLNIVGEILNMGGALTPRGRHAELLTCQHNVL
jgi:hypothetical protein